MARTEKKIVEQEFMSSFIYRFIRVFTIRSLIKYNDATEIV